MTIAWLFCMYKTLFFIQAKCILNMPINARIEDFDEDGLKELFEAALDKVNITDTDPTSVALP